jgi:hypothetical protein
MCNSLTFLFHIDNPPSFVFLLVGFDIKNYTSMCGQYGSNIVKVFLKPFNEVSSSHVSIAFQHALTSTIKRKIVFTCDACFRPSTTIKSHNLHVGDIRGAMGEIASYHKKEWLSPFLWAL